VADIADGTVREVIADEERPVSELTRSICDALRLS
jgi:hypothetical protein